MSSLDKMSSRYISWDFISSQELTLSLLCITFIHKQCDNQQFTMKVIRVIFKKTYWINVFKFAIESNDAMFFNYSYYTQWTPKITTIREKALNSTLINSVGTWNGRQKIIIINQNEKMKQKWIPRKMKEATWFGWSRIFGGSSFSSSTMCIYLYVF